MSDKIKIATIEFTSDEWKSVCALAQKKSKKAELDSLTQPNVLRLALGLEAKARGGARPNTGNRKPDTLAPSGAASTGQRGGRKK